MNYAQNGQRDAITQALMNVRNPPPRVMTAQMTPQLQQLPQPLAAPQMPGLGDDPMMRPRAAAPPPPAAPPMAAAAPQMPIGAPPMPMDTPPMPGPLPQDQASY